MQPPILETTRLFLRPLRASDATEFLSLAGDWGVARMTSDIPHPLSPAHAKAWLRPLAGDVRFAIELHGRMIGSVGYFTRRSGMAELGFWLGCDYWGLGYATEATALVVRHAFSGRRFKGFTSAYFADNPASGRVLAKLGFVDTGAGRLWCTARAEEIAAIGVQLTRERAEAALGPIELDPHEKSQWTQRIGRWLRSA